MAYLIILLYMAIKKKNRKMCKAGCWSGGREKFKYILGHSIIQLDLFAFISSSLPNSLTSASRRYENMGYSI